MLILSIYCLQIATYVMLVPAYQIRYFMDTAEYHLFILSII